VAFVILLLAQAGTPFTTGFLAKLGVITAAVSAASTPLALVAMLCAVIGGFAYLRVAITATAPEGTDLSLLGVDISMSPGSQVKVPVTSAVAIGLCVLVTVLFGLWPAPLTQLAHQASLLFIA
jgi:NADH-quinone oxidoreductase subunit N